MRQRSKDSVKIGLRDSWERRGAGARLLGAIGGAARQQAELSPCCAAATTAGEHGVAASAHAVQLRNKRCQRARRRRGSSPAQLREAPQGEPRTANSHPPHARRRASSHTAARPPKRESTPTRDADARAGPKRVAHRSAPRDDTRCRPRRAPRRSPRRRRRRRRPRSARTRSSRRRRGTSASVVIFGRRGTFLGS